jgi:hypothetical protein
MSAEVEGDAADPERPSRAASAVFVESSLDPPKPDIISTAGAPASASVTDRASRSP